MLVLLDILRSSSQVSGALTRRFVPYIPHTNIISQKSNSASGRGRSFFSLAFCARSTRIIGLFYVHCITIMIVPHSDKCRSCAITSLEIKGSKLGFFLQIDAFCTISNDLSEHTSVWFGMKLVTTKVTTDVPKVTIVKNNEPCIYLIIWIELNDT